MNRQNYYWCPTCKKEPSGSAENTSTGRRVCGECGKTYLEYRTTKQEADHNPPAHEPQEDLPSTDEPQAEQKAEPKGTVFMLSRKSYLEYIKDRAIAERAKEMLRTYNFYITWTELRYIVNGEE